MIYNRPAVLIVGLATEAALHGHPFGLATCRAVGLAKAEARQRSNIFPLHLNATAHTVLA